VGNQKKQIVLPPLEEQNHRNTIWDIKQITLIRVGFPEGIIRYSAGF
jgi:hypothetical protein